MSSTTTPSKANRSSSAATVASSPAVALASGSPDERVHRVVRVWHNGPNNPLTIDYDASMQLQAVFDQACVHAGFAKTAKAVLRPLDSIVDASELSGFLRKRLRELPGNDEFALLRPGEALEQVTKQRRVEPKLTQELLRTMASNYRAATALADMMDNSIEATLDNPGERVITITLDRANRTLVLEDNGRGMNANNVSSMITPGISDNVDRAGGGSKGVTDEVVQVKGATSHMSHYGVGLKASVTHLVKPDVGYVEVVTKTIDSTVSSIVLKRPSTSSSADPAAMDTSDDSDPTAREKAREAALKLRATTTSVVNVDHSFRDPSKDEIGKSFTRICVNNLTDAALASDFGQEDDLAAFIRSVYHLYLFGPDGAEFNVASGKPVILTDVEPSTQNSKAAAHRIPLWRSLVTPAAGSSKRQGLGEQSFSVMLPFMSGRTVAMDPRAAYSYADTVDTVISVGRDLQEIKTVELDLLSNCAVRTVQINFTIENWNDDGPVQMSQKEIDDILVSFQTAIHSQSMCWTSESNGDGDLSSVEQMPPASRILSLSDKVVRVSQETGDARIFTMRVSLADSDDTDFVSRYLQFGGILPAIRIRSIQVTGRYMGFSRQIANPKPVRIIFNGRDLQTDSSLQSSDIVLQMMKSACVMPKCPTPLRLGLRIAHGGRTGYADMYFLYFPFRDNTEQVPAIQDEPWSSPVVRAGMRYFWRGRWLFKEAACPQWLQEATLRKVLVGKRRVPQQALGRWVCLVFLSGDFTPDYTKSTLRQQVPLNDILLQLGAANAGKGSQYGLDARLGPVSVKQVTYLSQDNTKHTEEPLDLSTMQKKVATWLIDMNSSVDDEVFFEREHYTGSDLKRNLHVYHTVTICASKFSAKDFVNIGKPKKPEFVQVVSFSHSGADEADISQPRLHYNKVLNSSGDTDANPEVHPHEKLLTDILTNIKVVTLADLKRLDDSIANALFVRSMGDSADAWEHISKAKAPVMATSFDGYLNVGAMSVTNKELGQTEAIPQGVSLNIFFQCGNCGASKEGCSVCDSIRLSSTMQEQHVSDALKAASAKFKQLPKDRIRSIFSAESKKKFKIDNLAMHSFNTKNLFKLPGHYYVVAMPYQNSEILSTVQPSFTKIEVEGGMPAKAEIEFDKFDLKKGLPIGCPLELSVTLFDEYGNHTTRGVNTQARATLSLAVVRKDSATAPLFDLTLSQQPLKCVDGKLSGTMTIQPSSEWRSRKTFPKLTIQGTLAFVSPDQSQLVIEPFTVTPAPGLPASLQATSKTIRLLEEVYDVNQPFPSRLEFTVCDAYGNEVRPSEGGHFRARATGDDVGLSKPLILKSDSDGVLSIDEGQLTLKQADSVLYIELADVANAVPLEVTLHGSTFHIALLNDGVPVQMINGAGFITAPVGTILSDLQCVLTRNDVAADSKHVYPSWVRNSGYVTNADGIASLPAIECSKILQELQFGLQLALKGESVFSFTVKTTPGPVSKLSVGVVKGSPPVSRVSSAPCNVCRKKPNEKNRLVACSGECPIHTANYHPKCAGIDEANQNLDNLSWLCQSCTQIANKSEISVYLSATDEFGNVVTAPQCSELHILPEALSSEDFDPNLPAQTIAQSEADVAPMSVVTAGPSRAKSSSKPSHGVADVPGNSGAIAAHGLTATYAFSQATASGTACQLLKLRVSAEGAEQSFRLRVRDPKHGILTFIPFRLVAGAPAGFRLADHDSNQPLVLENGSSPALTVHVVDSNGMVVSSVSGGVRVAFVKCPPILKRSVEVDIAHGVGLFAMQQLPVLAAIPEQQFILELVGAKGLANLPKTTIPCQLVGRLQMPTKVTIHNVETTPLQHSGTGPFFDIRPFSCAVETERQDDLSDDWVVTVTVHKFQGASQPVVMTGTKGQSQRNTFEFPSTRISTTEAGGYILQAKLVNQSTGHEAVLSGKPAGVQVAAGAPHSLRLLSSPSESVHGGSTLDVVRVSVLDKSGNVCGAKPTSDFLSSVELKSDQSSQSRLTAAIAISPVASGRVDLAPGSILQAQVVGGVAQFQKIDVIDGPDGSLSVAVRLLDSRVDPVTFVVPFMSAASWSQMSSEQQRVSMEAAQLSEQQNQIKMRLQALNEEYGLKRQRAERAEKEFIAAQQTVVRLTSRLAAPGADGDHGAQLQALLKRGSTDRSFAPGPKPRDYPSAMRRVIDCGRIEDSQIAAVIETLLGSSMRMGVIDVPMGSPEFVRLTNANAGDRVLNLQNPRTANSFFRQGVNNDSQRTLKLPRPAHAAGFIDFAVNMIFLERETVSERATVWYFLLRDAMIFETQKHLRDFAEQIRSTDKMPNLIALDGYLMRGDGTTQKMKVPKRSQFAAVEDAKRLAVDAQGSHTLDPLLRTLLQGHIQSQYDNKKVAEAQEVLIVKSNERNEATMAAKALIEQHQQLKGELEGIEARLQQLSVHRSQLLGTHAPPAKRTHEDEDDSATTRRVKSRSA
ncbi:hypothetical protein CAOG_06537 [Capsaspora owczarzaki ATCC 30864]|uniref:hypothetical protein n=1 Tax=Capsaspora owczarzaki (strain ATCC 30864) TaxID=595528 RepID=UPI0003526447|nr:hypothetical protein CAOG_06537 [Capsaspora owczarzaki ATCC 30864]|eukprot:XP_004345286.2 hypothetical protein CAOG_06537 [Capsaspora owczarzaki ATCC 30864]